MPLHRVALFPGVPGLLGAHGAAFTHPTGPEAAPLASVATLRDLGSALKQHAQAVEQLAVAVEQTPAHLGAELRAAQDRLAGAVLFALALGLVAGLMIGHLSGRFRT